MIQTEGIIEHPKGGVKRAEGSGKTHQEGRKKSNPNRESSKLKAGKPSGSEASQGCL